ncbi:MAG: hypothetical protein ACI910_001714 [Oleispira sp.]
MELIDVLDVLLEENSEGFSEHKLLTLLQQQPHAFFAADALRDPLLLFQSHFLLFHCLYLLRNRWQKSHHAQLEISVFNIKKSRLDIAKMLTAQSENSFTEDKKSLFNADPMAQYYLDWSHFSTTSSDDVDELLNRFWKKVWVPQQEEDIQQALIIMELETPVPLPQLKQQYRRLAQRFHPDKGGNSEHFKKICQAFHQLRQY